MYMCGFNSSLAPDRKARGFESLRGVFKEGSWELRRPQLKAGNFAVIVGGAVASSPLPVTWAATGAPALASVSIPPFSGGALNWGRCLP